MITLSQTEPQTLLAAAQPWVLLKLCGDLRGQGFCWDEAPKTTVPGAERLAQESERLAQKLRAEPDALKELIEELRKFFDGVADGGVCTIRFMPGSALVLDAGARKAGREVIAGFDTPSTRDGFIQSVLLGAALYVAWSPDVVVRRCARKACRRVFVATRPKQIFCGRKCASAANFESYKEKLGENTYRAKRHEVMRRRKDRIAAAAKRKKARHGGPDHE